LLRLTYGCWRTAAKLEWLERYWDACGDEYTPAEMTGPCWLGLDLSQVSDLSALSLVERQAENAYRIYPWYWVPEERAKVLRRFVDIEGWQRQGHITIVPGHIIDPALILAKLVELYHAHDVQGLIYDPKEALLLVQQFEQQTGCDIFEFRQSYENYHEPTDNFAGGIMGGTIRHPNHPLLTWQAKHCIADQSKQGYIKPVKPDPTGQPHRTVDGIQASVMGFSQARLYQDEAVEIFSF